MGLARAISNEAPGRAILHVFPVSDRKQTSLLPVQAMLSMAKKITPV